MISSIILIISLQHESVTVALPATSPSNCRRSVKEFAKEPCLGRRTADGPFVYETYAEIGAKVDKMGSALAANGVKPKDAVGVIGPNSPEWMITMQGCNHQNVMCVPLYDALGANTVEFILQHSGACAIFAEASKLNVLTEVLSAIRGQVKLVGYWGKASDDVKQVLRGTISPIQASIFSHAHVSLVFFYEPLEQRNALLLTNLNYYFSFLIPVRRSLALA